jgi:protein-disulfide isomerase
MTLRHAAVSTLLATIVFAGCSRGSSRDGASEIAAGAAEIAGGAVATDSALLERADAGRIQGDSAAPVWMVIISDFQCPFCRRWHEESYHPIVQEFVRTGQLRLAFLQFPLPSHRHALPAAEATMCASAQGRFWEMQDAVLLAQERWAALEDASAAFDSLAAGLGVEMTAWRECIRSRATRPLVNLDLERARQMGVRSTPSFIVGDRAISGALPLDTFRVAIRDAVTRGRAAGAQR